MHKRYIPTWVAAPMDIYALSYRLPIPCCCIYDFMRLTGFPWYFCLQAQMLRETRAENLRQFQEVEGVHKQVIHFVDLMYLKALQNPITHP